MSNTLTIPFYTVKLHLATGGSIAAPLKDADAIRVSESPNILAGKYANLFQEKVLDKGQFVKVMSEFMDGDFQKDSLTVSFPASKDKISYPPFELEFEYFFNITEHGAWGSIPALGIEGFSGEKEELKKRLKEAVRLEFSRNKRLTAVQKIVSSVWFDAIELVKHDILLKLHSPKELDRLDKEKKDLLLPKIGIRLSGIKHTCHCREKEFDQLLRTVKSTFNKNALLIGPSGVGKTALVWELARQRHNQVIKSEIWETTASSLIKELSRDTGWEDNIIYLIQELREKGDFLFIRNFAELFEVGKYLGNEVSIAEYLRTFVQRGDLKIITETTDEELARIEIISPGYPALFQQIRMGEPPPDELREIIVKKVSGLAKQRKIQIEKEAIYEVIRLNRRFTPYAGFPGKPIRFIESLLVNLSHQKQSTRLSKKACIRHFCMETGMPPFLVDPNLPMDLKAIKAQFNNTVFGQEKAVEEVVDVLGTVKTALARTGKPIASFLFIGPTGVGKTELAKVLSEFTFGNRDRLVRFDMSEYSNPWSVSRLIGTDYYSDGLLTSAVRREPFCVLLFDEIEKANPAFYDLLLQILGEGRLTDNRGKLVNFCSTIIIMTSNIGASGIQSGRIGWKKEVDVEEVTHHFRKAAEKFFRPELFNRIDQIIPFEPLSMDTLRFVVEREIELLKKREGIRFRNLDLTIDDSVFDFLAREGYDAKYGARQLQRIIREKLIIPLSAELNQQDFSDRLAIRLITDGQKVNIVMEADPLGFDLLLEQWDKLNYADQASDLRRKMNLLKENPTMVHFFNEFDYLKGKKKKLGERFWKNRKRAESYSYFLQTIENTDNLSKKIEDLETEMALACMELGIFNPEFEKKLKEWKQGFLELKKQIYKRLHPKSDDCYFAIYGRNFEKILALYLSVFDGKGFEIVGNTVWFREGFYKEEIMEAEVNEKARELTPVRKAREEYLKKTWKRELKHPYPPPKAGDILHGIELKISGDCSFLFLKGERGIHRWKSDPKEDFLFFIKIANNQFETPKEIHRRKFYEKHTPRRIVQPGHFQDNDLKIKREVNLRDLSDLIIEILDKNFEATIEAAVV